LPAILKAVRHEIHGPDHVRRVRHGQSIGLVPLQSLAWLDPKIQFQLAIDAIDPQLGFISQKTKLAEAIRYALSRWDGLTRFIDDGRIEIDSNTIERSIRPIALNRKNALFAGSDAGAEHWATIASLIETAKLNDVEPLGYLADVLTRIVNGHPNSQIDALLPWSYRTDKIPPMKE
jgi:hypothetical protein